MSNKEFEEISVEQEIVHNCPLLFKMYGRPMNETCLSFGFECNKGWHNAIADACKEIETYNNIIYPKWRVRIQADQIKEKFGTLRFYYSVVVDPNPFLVKLSDIFASIYYKFTYGKIDYRLNKKYDIEPSKYNTTEELSKEEYEKQQKNKYKPCNVTLKEEDGKYFRIENVTNYGRWHYEPTKHKIIWKFKECCNKLRYIINGRCIKTNAYTDNAIEFLDRRASYIIRNLEKECENICEFCGKTIGTKWSPSCCTTGWIRYICEDCAKESEFNYIKNGELWHKNKMIKSKEDVDKERHAIENAFENFND